MTMCENFKPEMPPRQAIELLDQRIGNQLESYVLSLLLGRRKRGEVL
jgi:hypothetical protein